MQSSNGQPLTQQDERLLSPKGSSGRYTGEILLRTRPRIYREVARLLGEGFSKKRIQRICRVNRLTVCAVQNREAESKDARKKTLAGMLSDVATLGTERMTDKIGKASLRDATIGTGVAVGKLLALTGQTPLVQIANITLPSEAEREERRALHDKLDEIARTLADAQTPSE